VKKFQRLYEVPNNSYVQVKGVGPVYKFKHVDGMYSYCIDNEGNTVHLIAWTPVLVVDKPDKV
jgi:hypothetical protein